MPRAKPGLRIHVEPAFLDKLQAQADTVNLSMDDYVAFILRQQAMGALTTSTVPVARPPGRPAAHVDDVPPDVQRTATGFVGVSQRGARWFAKLDKTQLGPFSSAEIAAIARYHRLRGYEHGLGQRLADAGVVGPDTPVHAPYNSDLPAAATGAGTGTGAGAGVLHSGGCPGCHAPTSRDNGDGRTDLIAINQLCAACTPLWAAWSARPAALEAPPIGSTLDLKGSPVEESFSEYVRRMRRGTTQ